MKRNMFCIKLRQVLYTRRFRRLYSPKSASRRNRRVAEIGDSTVWSPVRVQWTTRDRPLTCRGLRIQNAHNIV